MDDSGAASDLPGGDTSAVIRAGLGRVLESDAFRAAPQLSAFLGFVVERVIAGRGAELKGYTIAVEALGRPADFDPQTDPIVRVEAGRLRRTLAQYYAGEGAGDPVRITMPVGAYVPVFELVEPALSEAPVVLDAAASIPAITPAPQPHDMTPPAPPTRRDRFVSRRWQLLAAAALCLALIPLGAWYLDPSETAPMSAGLSISAPRQPEIVARSLASAVPQHLTVLAVSLTDLPEDPRLTELARRFSRFLVDALSRFDDLVTVKAPSIGQTSPVEADYILEMTAQMVEGTMESFGRLRSVRDGRVVWSVSSTRLLSADDSDLPELARRLAIRLAEPFGIIHADVRQNAAPAAMRCIYQALDVRLTMKPEDHLAARTCIEDLIEQDPTFHPAWSQLAFLSLGEYSAGLNPQAGSPLDRAISAALTAVRLAPSSARAQQAMMDALFARGATDEALKAGRDAMLRNPYDPDVMADLGARYIQINRPAEGLPLLERAIELSVGHPPWYDFFALLGAHLMGAKRLSQGYGAFLATDGDAYALLGRAIRERQSGNPSGVADAVAELQKTLPLFQLDPRLYLMRQGFGPEVSDRLISDLAPASP